jgi:integrase
MARKRRLPPGCRFKRNKIQTFVKIRGKVRSATFELDTDDDVLTQWHKDEVAQYGDAGTVAGTFADDIEKYLRRVSAMTAIATRRSHLYAWREALGGDRSRQSITAEEIDVHIQARLKVAGRGTVRGERYSLQAFFRKLDPKRPNPVKASKAIKPPKPAPRGRDMLLIERAIAAMGGRSHRGHAGSKSKVRAEVIAQTGIPPAMLEKVLPGHLWPSPTAAKTIRLQPRSKGEGVEARDVELTARGSAAFARFHAANAYGTFNRGALNNAFKRGAARVGIAPGTIRIYDLRHSFLSHLYRVTRDLGTVARFALHAEGSPLTAMYAAVANEAVDRSAVAAFDASLPALPTPPPAPAVTPMYQPGRKRLPAKVARFSKSRKRNKLEVAV